MGTAHQLEVADLSVELRCLLAALSVGAPLQQLSDPTPESLCTGHNNMRGNEASRETQDCGCSYRSSVSETSRHCGHCLSASGTIGELMAELQFIAINGNVMRTAVCSVSVSILLGSHAHLVQALDQVRADERALGRPAVAGADPQHRGHQARYERGSVVVQRKAAVLRAPC